MKKLLRRTLRKSCLDYAEMLTLLLDCEAIVNSRPITFMSDNDNKVMPLSPSNFLLELKEIYVLDLDNIEKCRLNESFAHRQTIKDDLRQRFSNEYLGALTYPKKSYNVNPINIGDLVLFDSDSTKRFDWPLAKIKDMSKGKAGNIRVVRLIKSYFHLSRALVQKHQFFVSSKDDFKE